MPLIDLKNVGLTLTSPAGPVEILKDINLTISEGEAVCIVGPSGSGKTSCLMITGGLEAATGGEVMVCGFDFTNQDEDALARIRGENIGIVFQSFHLVPTMTALENVALPLEFAGHTNAYAKANEALGNVGLAHRLSHYPQQLSGGEQQRVAIARALAPSPKLLLADEPTGNLDGETGTQVMDLLFDLHDKTNTTLLLVTHDHDLTKRCSRVIEMGNGKIVNDNRQPVKVVA